MTESNGPAEAASPAPRGLALALQGGGPHGAFSWGVLDRLLEDGLEIGAICGVSSGAITAAMLVQGLVCGGVQGARAELAQLWTRVAQTSVPGHLPRDPWEHWAW